MQKLKEQDRDMQTPIDDSGIFTEVSRNAQALFPLVHNGSHTTNVVGMISQDYKPLRCTTLVRASTE